MTKRMLEKVYSDVNVYDQALKRIDYCYNMFDHVFVSFSGGKDSLTMLLLVKEYFKQKGINDKINVCFYDEELIPSAVVDFVNEVRNDPQVNMYYFCTPIHSEQFLCGEKKKYIQWDPKRKHIRPMPEYAITMEETLHQAEIITEYFADLKGSICEMVGLRTDESITRLRGVFKSTGIYPFLNGSKDGKRYVSKPIYDWSEKDVFKLFYDMDAKYCMVYDIQKRAGLALRVSTPLHAEAAKTYLLKLKEMDTKFFQQIIDVFPETEYHVLYYKQMSKSKKRPWVNYDATWIGVMKFARDHVGPDLIEDCLKKVATCKRYRESKRLDDLPPFHGYPIQYVMEQIYKGAYKRYIPPALRDDVKDSYYEFEGIKKDS